MASKTSSRVAATIHGRYATALEDLPLRLSGRSAERSAHKDQLVWPDDPADRARLRRGLAEAGVETKGYYEVAIPDLTAFSGRVESADRSRALAARSFAIPIHARLEDDRSSVSSMRCAPTFGA